MHVDVPFFYLTLVIGVVIGMIVAGLLHMSSQSDGETRHTEPERLPDRRRKRRMPNRQQ